MATQDGAKPSGRIVEPTLHFVRRQFGGEDGRQPLLVPELVRPGQLLADYANPQPAGSDEPARMALQAGHHTDFTTDRSGIIATAFGYPKVEQLTGDGGTDQLLISLIPLIRISFDQLRAVLVIYPTIPGHAGLLTEDLPQILQEAGVHHGLDEAALAEARRLIRAGEPEIAEVAIAEGSLPGPGTDATLEFTMEIGPLPGRIHKDGSIDFRERRIMVGIERGQLIARKIPAVPGSPGRNVLGEEIEPKSGRDMTIFVQGDAVYQPTTLEVRALKNGVLSVINNNTIRVSAHQVVHGDVDYHTGNIESHGCLTVNGSIYPGFTVYSAGDLVIGGSVMSATVVTDANAVIKGGITGKSSQIRSGGDLDIKFIEQGTLDAGGLVVIRSQSYFSRVTSRADIRCHPASKVMGGTLIAAGHLSLGSVGTESSEPAVLGAGIDPERLALLEATQLELKEKQDELIHWLQLHGSGRSRKVRAMEKAIDETKLRLLTLNLIPGTGLYSRGGKGSSRDEIDEVSPLYHQGLDIDRIRIDVHGTAHTGSKLLLGNRSLILPQPVSRRQFKLSADLKRIISFPLRG